MPKLFQTLFVVILLWLISSVTYAQSDDCYIELEIMITTTGVDFVRTPDACFENLSDWSYDAQYVEINGLRQAYIDEGSMDAEETILLLHGHIFIGR